jgi:uncharacterized protein YggE
MFLSWRKAAGLVACAMLAAAASAQTIQINRENKTIAISATDEATATADIAAVTVGFEVFGADSQTAYAEGARVSHAVMETLHKFGVKDEQIESGNQNLQRVEDNNDKDSAEIRAKRQFVLRQNWTVSVPPEVAAEVIRLAVEAGANKTGNIDWQLADQKNLQAKAAGNALVKARAVAANMAAGLNVKLGVLIYASNEVPESTLFTKRFRGESFGVAGVEGSLTAQKLEIRPKTIHESATVYAVFAIE